jgi:hypothetical protein
MLLIDIVERVTGQTFARVLTTSSPHHWRLSEDIDVPRGPHHRS